MLGLTPSTTYYFALRTRDEADNWSDVSNLVSATTVYRVMVPVAIATGVGNPLAMAFIIAAGANYAFALPSATTSTALVTGSGWVPVGFMLKYGILLIIPVVLLLTFIGYPLAALVFR
jgi:sodium-dependent dicarboxylate transporter 2/3/5